MTIPIDDETKFATGPGEEGDVSDLAEGDRVLVTGPKGEAADIVFVPPTRAELRREFKGHGARPGRLMPPPRGRTGRRHGDPAATAARRQIAEPIPKLAQAAGPGPVACRCGTVGA